MKYNAKLIILGEYTVIVGSNALAIPFSRYGGEWRQAEIPHETLPVFADYLESVSAQPHAPAIDLRQLREDLKNGYYFDSDIPAGYGLGSSGALCAAVYDRYAQNKIHRGEVEAYPLLKKQLAVMESFFHGSSSGTDPLISYLNRPILLLEGGEVESVQMPPQLDEEPYRFFLIDTGIQRKTGPLVNLFLKKCDVDSYAGKVESRLAPDTNSAIQYLLAGEWDKLFGRWRDISEFQLKYLPEMIPESFVPIWKKGLKTDVFNLKLCGAGGGGFLLGFTRDLYLTNTFLEKRNITPLPIEI